MNAWFRWLGAILLNALVCQMALAEAPLVHESAELQAEATAALNALVVSLSA